MVFLLPEITELIYFPSREKWRKWLEKNHAKKKDVWLLYYKAHTGKKRIPYDDAVEEAICFGWIDTTVKKVDHESFAQRFTPRNPKSSWSETNLMRARKMILEGKMAKSGLEKLGNALNEKIKKKNSMSTPKDLKEALGKKPRALENFMKYPPSHKRHYLWWLADAKKPETRKRRIKKVVEFALENKKPGET